MDQPRSDQEATPIAGNSRAISRSAPSRLCVAAQLMTRRGWLVRGESVVASTGLLLAVMLLAAMAASTWWTVRHQREAVTHLKNSHLIGLSTLLAHAAESLLAANEVSSFRRLVTDTARANSLVVCRIELADGRVIADADPARITVQQLPDQWPAVNVAGIASGSSSDIAADDAVDRTKWLEVPHRGPAKLIMRGSPVDPQWQTWESQAGLGIIGAVGMLALLVIYRRMRANLQAMGAIREALLARHAGEQAAAALLVSAHNAPEASAWNGLVSENDRLRTQVLAQHISPGGISASKGFADLESVCDAMWQGLLLVDEQLRIKYANGAAAVLLRTKREEIVGELVTALAVDDSLLVPIQQVVSGTLRRRVTSEIRLQACEADGDGDPAAASAKPSVLRFSIRPVRRSDIPGGAAAMIIIEDVTQQRLADEARNLFIAQATHELRMPLTNIRLYTENAIEQVSAASHHQPASSTPALSPETLQSLNVINQESKRLERIVGDMLSVTEIEAGTLKLRINDVRLDTLFDELHNDYRTQAAEKNIALHFNLPPKLPTMHGDRDKITLALHNLIGNALKYTPEGGNVTVNVDLTDKPPFSLIVEVTDSGIGIADDELELVFEKFYRSKKDQRVSNITGTGLGLAVAREVIRMHRGDITVRSQIDKGSSFTMTIPTMLEAA